MPKEYDIVGLSGVCSSCGKAFAAGEEFIACLFADEDRYIRKDFCSECSRQQEDEIRSAFSHWRSKLPAKDDKNKKPRINTDVLIEFFEKTADDDAPEKINFRFVLALMLMRKKVLVYDGSERDEMGREVWKMHFRASKSIGQKQADKQVHLPVNRQVKVIRANLDEEQIVRTGQRIGELLEIEQ